ncbi:MAG: glycosyltransferase [Solirubrobacteraceae bacterium]
MLVISGRFPRVDGRGDQVRGWQSVRWLAAHNEVTLLCGELAPPAEVDRVRELAHVVSIPASRVHRGMSALAALAARQPGQCGWITPGRTWQAARRLARDADVVLAITSRSVRGRLDAPIVLDHIDALSFNMSERARDDESPLVRLGGAIEARLMASWERRLTSVIDAQIASSSDVARMLPREPPAHVIPIAWAGEAFREPPGHIRDIDLIFTGDMSYPPNRAGATWLREQILPRVRARRPQTVAWIVGRSAAGLAGPDLRVASDVPDLHSYLRRARVAVAPIRGAGSPLKTIEGAACGAAVVASPWALDCYRLPGSPATDAEGFARAILQLLDDEAARCAQVRALQAALVDLTPERLGTQLEQILEAAAQRRRPPSVDPRAPSTSAGRG